MKPGYRFGLVISAAFVLFLYKGLTIAPLGPSAILLAWALEMMVLSLAWGLSWALEASPRRALRALSALAFYPLFYTVLVCSLAHTYFFESAAERRISLLELDLRTLGFFFTKVLPLRGLALLSGLLGLIHLLALPIARFSAPMRRLRVALVLTSSGLAMALLLALSPRVPSPLADIATDLWEQFTMEQVVVDRTPAARHAPRVLDRSKTPNLPPRVAFEKVLVFVMETMTSELLLREQEALPASTFVHSAQPHAHLYARYFATNQDSRTGMLSMLGSRFIPYEAYTEQGRDHYMFLGQQSSLVDLFKKLGFKSAFAVSQQEIELVVGDLPWDETLHLAEGEASELAKTYLCFVPYEFEHSCEDRALLPRVLDFIDRNERAFLYQEFIWGHASEYNKASGKTNTEYYSAYLDAIVRHLEQTGALDETLIVLTSDHGFRDKGLQTQRSVYQLPLLFYARRFEPRLDDQLHSHLDFKDLLVHHLVEGAPAPAASPFVMVIGPTGTSFLSVLTEPGALLVMKAREGERYLVHAEGQERSEAALRAGEFLRLYEDYLGYFNGLDPQARARTR